MLSIIDAMHELETRGLSRAQLARDLGTSVTHISKYLDGRIRNVGLKMATKIWNTYEIQIMPYSMEDISGIHRKGN